MTHSTASARRSAVILLLTLVLASLALAAPLPEGLDENGRRAAVVGAVMACFWVTEIAPLAATALLPVALFPLLGVSSLGDTGRAYADPLVFLFLGGFVLAAALERHGLDRRVAALALRLAGRRRSTLVLAVMLTTAFLSLWISNTATAMVMTPIALSLAGRQARSGEEDGFAPALMLGVAFAATIGGMGSLIGTPPNALFAGYLARAHGVEIGFGAWMAIGLPIVAILLPIAWALLTRVSFDLSDEPVDVPESALSTGPITAQQTTVAVILALTALAWITRPFLPGAGHLSDAGIAILAALALFLLPVEDAQGRRLLEWPDLARLRWDVLILFGGGLALAQALAGTGVADWLGGMVGGLKAAPLWLISLVMMTAIVYLGELASNTAMAAIFLPISGAMATALGADPLVLSLTVALAASLGFMLPVATPPNAIVYGSGCVTARQMLRAGAWLDVISIGVVFVLAQALGPLLLALLA